MLYRWNDFKMPTNHGNPNIETAIARDRSLMMYGWAQFLAGFQRRPRSSPSNQRHRSLMMYGRDQNCTWMLRPYSTALQFFQVLCYPTTKCAWLISRVRFHDYIITWQALVGLNKKIRNFLYDNFDLICIRIMNDKSLYYLNG